MFRVVAICGVLSRTSGKLFLAKTNGFLEQGFMPSMVWFIGGC